MERMTIAEKFTCGHVGLSSIIDSSRSSLPRTFLSRVQSAATSSNTSKTRTMQRNVNCPRCQTDCQQKAQEEAQKRQKQANEADLQDLYSNTAFWEGVHKAHEEEMGRQYPAESCNLCAKQRHALSILCGGTPIGSSFLSLASSTKSQNKKASTQPRLHIPSSDHDTNSSSSASYHTAQAWTSDQSSLSSTNSSELAELTKRKKSVSWGAVHIIDKPVDDDSDDDSVSTVELEEEINSWADEIVTSPGTFPIQEPPRPTPEKEMERAGYIWEAPSLVWDSIPTFPVLLFDSEEEEEDKIDVLHNIYSSYDDGEEEEEELTNQDTEPFIEGERFETL